MCLCQIWSSNIQCHRPVGHKVLSYNCALGHRYISHDFDMKKDLRAQCVSICHFWCPLWTIHSCGQFPRLGSHKNTWTVLMIPSEHKGLDFQKSLTKRCSLFLQKHGAWHIIFALNNNQSVKARWTAYLKCQFNNNNWLIGSRIINLWLLSTPFLAQFQEYAILFRVFYNTIHPINKMKFSTYQAV